jgi:hypothetical protein
VEGLRNVIIGPQFEADDAIHQFGFGGDHDNRNVSGIPHLPCQVEPVVAAESQIERDEVDGFVLELLQQLAATLRLERAHARRCEPRPQHMPYIEVILDDQDRRRFRRTIHENTRHGLDRDLNSTASHDLATSVNKTFLPGIEMKGPATPSIDLAGSTQVYRP